MTPDEPRLRVHDGEGWQPATTYEEWRVTGDPGEGFPPYEFVWSPLRNPDHATEGEARGFVRLIESVGGWPDGPHLHKRTVTVTEWQEVEA